MHSNIRIAIRRLHARSSPTHTTNILRALIEDMSDSDGNVNTAYASAKEKNGNGTSKTPTWIVSLNDSIRFGWVKAYQSDEVSTPLGLPTPTPTILAVPI
jgi:hypothetical protein